MLGKLLKYEFKATGRMIGSIYLVILVVAVLTGLSGRFMDQSSDTPPAFVILLIVYGCLVFALLLITVLMIIERFYKNLLQGEGYLMHTLPVPTWMHVASKTISAFVWEVLAVVVIGISGVLGMASGGVWTEILTDIDLAKLWEVLDQNKAMIALLLIAVFVQLIRITLMFYAAMAIGGSANRNKVLYGIFAFVAIIIISNIISALGQTDAVSTLIFDTSSVVGGINNMRTALAGRSVVVDLIYSAIFFGITQYFLQKKLNLE